MAREIRIEVPDEVYEQLQHLAESSHVPAEQYAQELLTADLGRARFIEGAQLFIDEHAEGFAARFGHPHNGRDVA